MEFGSGNYHFDLTLYPLPIRTPTRKMKHITVNTYRKDKYYPRVVRTAGKILARADVVAPSDILIETGNLFPIKIMKRGVKGKFFILNEYLAVDHGRSRPIEKQKNHNVSSLWGFL
jgi:hypothetical protein